MTFPTPDSPVYLIISALCGGGATKLLDFVTGSRKVSSEITATEKKQDAEAREELRREAKRYRDEAIETATRYRGLIKELEEQSESECVRCRLKLQGELELAENERDEYRLALFEKQKNDVVELSQVQGYLTELDELREQVQKLQRLNDTLTARLRVR